MKLTIERAALQKALAHVQSVVERRTTIPILSNVLVEARGDVLSLAATDMDIAILEKVPAEIGAPGETTLPAHTLYDIVRKLPEGAQIELEGEGEGKRLELKAGRSKFTLSSLPTEEFPVLDDGELPHSFSLPASDLRALIERTRFAMSTEETRYYLNGIYLHAAESDGIKVLRIVATDGHRLAQVEMPQPEGAADIPGVIVPRKAVAELHKLIEDSDETVAISLSDTRIRFAFDHVVLTSKLVDGTFPDYQRVIPEGNDKIMEVDCAAFAEAVDRVSTISTEKSRAVKVEIDKGRLTLTASSPEHGTATEELEVKYDSDPIEIGFNSRYLLDITQQIEGGTVRIDLADASAPTIVRDIADNSALYVLMPMRV
ncbi:MAG: DNA polymerase III subunit beta [Rhodospirillaceae bacterium]|jgi:DNA polymerase III subunit beta|nr:DNA polymerase III subunit beta [Rhodospirillaceae bacterium]MBT5373452.1 DNA polymerase III subunit beta [Rhodospirillaceae bacterium]MBT5659183.1 DNA polymerase III subunit beta [Rhodospirillaceae bacterium]MBT5751086.1 DNA polymerase III subunit beta [Rhodospirillaceae bacterium]